MVSPWKKNWIFEKWSWVFMKTANGSKIAVGCNWISKGSQSFKKVVSPWKENEFSKNDLEFL